MDYCLNHIKAFVVTVVYIAEDVRTFDTLLQWHIVHGVLISPRGMNGPGLCYHLVHMKDTMVLGWYLENYSKLI